MTATLTSSRFDRLKMPIPRSNVKNASQKRPGGLCRFSTRIPMVAQSWLRAAAVDAAVDPVHPVVTAIRGAYHPWQAFSVKRFSLPVDRVALV